MKTGYLIWDASQQRSDIKYNDVDHYGGLHCGDARYIVTNEGNNIRSRIEYNDKTGNWYIPDIPHHEDILWLQVKKQLFL